MTIGILVIGSLFWDTRCHRRAWRELHLLVDRATEVSVPIRYGRRSTSRNQTYTVTLSAGASNGVGLLVPCRDPRSDAMSVQREAEALWYAEQPEGRALEPAVISASWGCVGAMCKSGMVTPEWTQWFAPKNGDPGVPFRKAVGANKLVDTSGRLQLSSWPKDVPADIDVLLCTATVPDLHAPAPAAIAEAWCSNGSEDYFFENVRAGIRTADDSEIWKHIIAREAKPSWIARREYAAAMQTLNAELERSS